MRIIYFILLSLFSQSALSMIVEGQIRIDSTWKQVGYLSIINQFSDLNTASYHFLIAEISLGPNGDFKILINGLPEEDHLYRLHFCPVGDPVSTIIIGGQNENFVHFIANARSEIKIQGGDGRFISGKITIEGNPANASLTQLFDWKRVLHTAPGLSTGQNRLRIQNEMKENLLQMMDTSSSSLIRLMALFFYDDLETSPLVSLYQDQFDKLTTSDSSPYANQFRDRFEYLAFRENGQKQNNMGFTSGLIIGFFVILLISILLFYNHQTRLSQNPGNQTRNDSDIQFLSSQERRVLDLLKERRSNKEIASELNIEVTTVKSHVYRIYNKMGIKSRKELWG